MQPERRPRLVDGRLPVFVFPTELTFVIDDRSSHKQVLTIYNPYEFPLKYKVLSTQPRKYSVVDPEGSIKSGCCIDVVIRHKDLNEDAAGQRHRFRISVFERGRREVIGHKDIPVSVAASRSLVEPEDFSLSPPSEASRNLSIPSSDGRQMSGPGTLIILVAIVCIAALMLPTQGEKSNLPEYLHLTFNQKLIAAYVLGLVTMVLLRA